MACDAAATRFDAAARSCGEQNAVNFAGEAIQARAGRYPRTVRSNVISLRHLPIWRRTNEIRRILIGGELIGC